MKNLLINFIVLSFIFIQVTCVASEGYEIILESEHHQTLNHGDFSKTNEINISDNHENEMPSGAHCVHSHPPAAFICSSFQMASHSARVDFTAQGIDDLVSIYHRPPVTPPIS
jgi:hypothetical protein